MNLCGIGRAEWHGHVNHVNPPRILRDWLTDTVSLTVKLIARSEHFRVRRLCQVRALPVVDEFSEVGLARRIQVQQREVLLQCDGRPVVFAHTIVPLDATTSDWPFFGTLGERSLGTTLFGDPRVQRGRLQFARLQMQHPLARRARATIGAMGAQQGPLYARRCLYRRCQSSLLVTELFLPAIAALPAPRGNPPIERHRVR